ncbi:class I SAM-dependent methyltransferase [Kiloniella litopenaei]|uniref:class I SAM-dependent methyltransferase n=1 Tax=Kiloniella litopenaei TaxID=1549748 RepID=UPI003BA8B74A
MQDQAPKDHYHDPLLTRLYDLQNPWGPDCDFFLGLTKRDSGVQRDAGTQRETKPQRILDVGCGTGLLTVAFAEQGHDITGIDPALDMLAIAETRPFGDKVSWSQSDAATFKSDLLYDLIILSGHAFQVFLTDRATHDALSNLKSLLAPEGRIAFDTRNPQIKSWENWTPSKTKETFVLPVTSHQNKDKSQPQEIEVWHDLGKVEKYGDGKIVQYFTLYQTKEDGSERVPLEHPSTSPIKTEAQIRFLSDRELAAHIEKAGLSLEHLYGDWDRTPFEKDSKEMIVVARLRP